ncbi:MAG: phage major capsid protein [Oscillospiraceae bacterium]|jgi:hypothetical protein|nr:phage major capsid protein [Oscillospiraceae bacterium]
MANYETIRLEKGMYAGDFTTMLEKMDASENYRETALEGLDAFERQLKRFDIHVSGAQSDRIEKFFQSSDSAVLFPEYIARAVKQGMKDANMLDSVVATTTQVDAPDYRPLAVDPASIIDEQQVFPIIGEGEQIPAYTLKNGDSLVALQKRGRIINTTYESLRFHRLDLFTVFLKQIGAQLAREQFNDAVEMLLDDAEEIEQATNNINYTDLLELWTALQPFNLNTLIVNPAHMTKVMNLAQFRDSAGGCDFHATGKLIHPLGATLLPACAMPDNQVLGLDKNSALEMITAGDVLLESSKLIDRQLDCAAITCLAGFSRIFPEARKLVKPFVSE